MDRAIVSHGRHCIQHPFDSDNPVAVQLKQREPRLHDSGFLAWLRRRPCVVCGKGPPCDPAHIRFGSEFYGKPPTGMAEKPSDKWCVSLCRACHIKQHGQNEQEFWRERRILVLALAQKLYAEYGGRGGRARQKKKRTTIVPAGLGIKRTIVSRPFPRAKRKIKNRGFK